MIQFRVVRGARALKRAMAAKPGVIPASLGK